MNAAEVLEALEEHGAVRHGHFRLSSGLHSNLYVQCALLLQWPGIAERLGHELGGSFARTSPTVVVGPAMGGILIGHEVARYLGDQGVRMVFCERVDGRMTFRRGLTVEPHDRVLIVEDVVTTGRSPREAIDLVGEASAEVVGVGSIVDRSQGVSFGVPFRSLVKLEGQQWTEQDCPLCRSGDEPKAPGSRYLAR